MKYIFWGTMLLGPVTSSNAPATLAAILDLTKIENFDGKSRKLKIFAVNLKCDIIKRFVVHNLYFLPEKGKKKQFFFKNGLSTCYL